MSQHILQELFGEDNQGTITDEFLRRLGHHGRNIKDKFINLFEHLIAKIYDRYDQELPPLPSDLVQVMQVWRDHSEGNYQCLRRKLDQFSVFAGRNPLVSDCVSMYPTLQLAFQYISSVTSCQHSATLYGIPLQEWAGCATKGVTGMDLSSSTSLYCDGSALFLGFFIANHCVANTE